MADPGKEPDEPALQIVASGLQQEAALAHDVLTDSLYGTRRSAQVRFGLTGSALLAKIEQVYPCKKRCKQTWFGTVAGPDGMPMRVQLVKPHPLNGEAAGRQHLSVVED